MCLIIIIIWIYFLDLGADITISSIINGFFGIFPSFASVVVGDVTTATQMVRMVVELHLLVVVVGFEVTACSSCACHCPCLCRLRRTIVAAEALTVYVVVIVLTVIRLVKRLVVFFNGLQLLTIFCLIVYGYTISLIACIRYSSWVCLLCSPIYAAFLILLQIQS